MHEHASKQLDTPKQKRGRPHFGRANSAKSSLWSKLALSDRPATARENSGPARGLSTTEPQQASRPNDAFEREADRVANEVVSQPKANSSNHPRTNHQGELGRVAASLESRLGVDLSKVQLHINDDARRSADAIGAKAYNLGWDVVMGSGAEPMGTSAGKRLLTHELVHVAQRQLPAKTNGTLNRDGSELHERIPVNTLAASWAVVNPTARTPASTGRTNLEVIEDGFQGICPSATASGSNVGVSTGLKSSDAGCQCLVEIEKDIAKGGAGVLKSQPKVEPDPLGWSSTSHADGHVLVKGRHPDTGSYEWGYWTGKTAKSPEHRHTKPFWQTLAHEICGHVLSGVQSGGSDWGGRSTSLGHNRAIEGENKVAKSKSIPVSEHRGLDIDPATGSPMPGHRGESFLQASIVGFGQNSGVTPATSVIKDTVDTIARLRSQIPNLAFRMQLEGIQSGMESPGFNALRATVVHAELITEFAKRKIKLPTFDSLQFTTVPGPVNTARDRAVKLFIYHNIKSAAP
jgi:hypothetical protein